MQKYCLVWDKISVLKLEVKVRDGEEREMMEMEKREGWMEMVLPGSVNFLSSLCLL